jgi:hypothetical protein
VKNVQQSLKKLKKKKKDIDLRDLSMKNWICDRCEKEALMRSVVDGEIKYSCSDHIHIYQ